jgi:hypothetical protein
MGSFFSRNPIPTTVLPRRADGARTSDELQVSARDVESYAAEVQLAVETIFLSPEQTGTFRNSPSPSAPRN